MRTQDGSGHGARGVAGRLAVLAALSLGLDVTGAAAQGRSFHFPWQADAHGRRFTGGSAQHTGEATYAWDINRGTGDTDCGDAAVSAETGTVTALSCDDEFSRLGYGCYVKVGHGGGYVSVYAHLRKGSQRGPAGRYTCRGTVVGWVGKTGLPSGGKCHLHFHVTKDGLAHDPVPVWGKTGPHDACAALTDITIDDRTPYWSCTRHCREG
ncbi:hypothetical protein DCC79_08700 [bacterium]|nr:M23 family peptidase [Chloroflexi bacterium CFX6]RIL10205.1 MAG: hypothetical protein DCC79_08700 [bacterium]